MFTNGLGDQGSIPGWVIWKTQKMVLDAALLSTPHYKARIGVVAIEMGSFRWPLTMVANYIVLEMSKGL